MRRSIAIATVAGMTLLGLITGPRPANAKTPGENGQIVFSRVKSDDNAVTYTMNPDGTQLRRLFPGFSSSAHWSPDGSQIALLSCLDPPVCDTAAVIVNVDSGTYRGLTRPDPSLFTACSIWSPDSKRLACEGQGNTDPNLNGIYTIRASDGRGVRRITSIPGGDDIPIDYSPNGKELVFGRTDPSGPAGRNQALFIANLGTGAVQRVTPWGWSDDDGSWSPDGTKIIFEHFGALYTVHPDGSGLSKINLRTGSSTTAFTAFDGSWSPDGTKIVFSLNVQGPAGSVVEGIGTANADGSDVQMIATSPTRDHKADWGPHPPATR